MRRSIALMLACLALPSVGAAQEEDEIVRQAFLQAFGTVPVGSRAMDLGRSPGAGAAIAAGRSAVASPTDRALQTEFADRLGSVIGADRDTNVLELLHIVLKESTSEMNETKKYWLKKLVEQNGMSEELSEYLEELSDASQKLGRNERGAANRSQAPAVPVTVRTFDPVWLETLGEPSGWGRATLCDPCLTTRAATLNAEQVQREQESVLGLHRRLEAARVQTEARLAEVELQSAAVVLMLAEVLKAVDEERDGAIRGALGPTS